MILLQDQTESNIPAPGSKLNLGYYRFNQGIHANLKTGNIYIHSRKGHMLTNANLVRKMVKLVIVVHTADYGVQ